MAADLIETVALTGTRFYVLAVIEHATGGLNADLDGLLAQRRAPVATF